MNGLDPSGASTAPPPALDIDREVALMEAMSVDRLRAKFAEVCGEPTRSRHKQYLIKRIAWRMQANAEGGLSERALKRAMELANDAEIRLTAPRPPKASAGAEERTVRIGPKVRRRTELLPGMSLQRQYKGRQIFVRVLEDGFDWDGQHFQSLTAVAQAVTGKHWGGFHFFNLRQQGGKP